MPCVLHMLFSGLLFVGFFFGGGAFGSLLSLGIPFKHCAHTHYPLGNVQLPFVLSLCHLRHCYGSCVFLANWLIIWISNCTIQNWGSVPIKFTHCVHMSKGVVVMPMH